MSQQVLDVYAPLVKVSAGESLPVAAIGGQTRDGKDEIILGTVPFVRNASNTLWVPVDKDNPLEARVRALEDLIGALNATKVTDPDAASATLLALLRGLLSAAAKESTLGSLASAVAKDATLSSILSALGDLATEATLSDVASDLSTLAGTVSDGAAKVALSGQIVDSDENAVRVKTSALAWKSWDPFGTTVFVPAGTYIDSPGDATPVNGFGTLSFILRRPTETKVGQVDVSVYWQSIPGPRENSRAVPESFEVDPERAGLAMAVPTKSQYVGFRLYNRSATDATYHFHAMLRTS